MIAFASLKSQLILVASLVIMSYSYGQPSQATSLDTGWQLGFYPSELAIGIVSFDGAYSFKGRHTVGIVAGTAYKMFLEDEDLFSAMNNGWHIRPYHKVFLNSPTAGSFTYIRHGPRFSWYNYRFESAEWVSFNRDGLPMLRFDTVMRNETSTMVGYDFIIGKENRWGAFYTDIFGGLGLRKILNIEQLAIRPQEEREDISQVSHYDGLTLIIGLRIGFYLN